MKVYIMQCNYPCYEHVVGVYETLDKAEEARSGDPHMRIHEWEVE